MKSHLFGPGFQAKSSYLHADKPSLFACSLICRTWLPSSRYHLPVFSRVVLRASNIIPFSMLLEHPLNNIVFVVWHLAVSTVCFADYGKSSASSMAESLMHGAATVLPILPRLTAQLRMLKSLSLSEINWTLCSAGIL